MSKRNSIFKLTFLCLMTIICTLAISMNGSAKTQKSKAMAAYKKYLTSHFQPESDGYDGYDYYLFATAYIDNNNVPELLVIRPQQYESGSNGTLYTYSRGKVVKIGTVDCGDFNWYDNNTVNNKTSVRYIEKGSLIYDNSDGGYINYSNDCNGCTFFYYYRKISNGKTQKLSYYKIHSFDLNEVPFTNITYNKNVSGTVCSKLIASKHKYQKMSTSDFNKAIKKYTKSKKFKKFVFHINTNANVNKYVK